jgi:hypothetical protein
VEFDIQFAVTESPADVEIALSGAPTPQGFQLLNERLVSDARFRAGLTLLVDLSRLDTSELTEDVLQGMSEPVVERDWHYPPAAVAIVAADERTAGFARSYRAALGGSKSRRQVFETRADAVAWLVELCAP